MFINFPSKVRNDVRELLDIRSAEVVAGRNGGQLLDCPPIPSLVDMACDVGAVYLGNVCGGIQAAPIDIRAFHEMVSSSFNSLPWPGAPWGWGRGDGD